MTDYAVNVCHMDIDEFWRLFISSGCAKSFGIGEPRVVSGMSGTELAWEVLEKVGIDSREMTAQIEYDRSREYWSGWILAYYQWYTGKSFKDIFERLPMSEVQRLYPTLHEASESKFVDVADKICFLEASDTKLKKIRKSSGYSQRELAEKSGVSIRMIQQYEIKAKDINKAAGETLMALSRVLGCAVEDLLEV